MNLPRDIEDPPREFSVMPFWFWNDALDAAEIVRQIADFESHGVYGFIIHPRIGLPDDVQWMSDGLLDLYAVAIEEAAHRGMKVLLYDEGMYPSGSSAGQVVAENPEFACRCLARIPLARGEEPVLQAGQNLVGINTRSDGTRLAVIDRKANSYIRGLHYQGEGPKEETYPAGDILNPDAVATFLRLVYDRFASRFSDHFGKTIIAMFTDEPNLLGKCRESGVRPGTTGILEHVSRILGYDFSPHLASLWDDDEPDARRHRTDYCRALEIRLEETYYRQLHDWCEQHGLPLTGHPHKGDDFGVLRYFHIPGQDLVWRWVLPDHPSALEGEQSTQGKCTSSAALHGQRRRNANECCGAYGHELTWDEMLWLANWCFVRGVNLLYPHAFYYSVRGPRLDERPPDVGPNSAWWDRYPEYAIACRRLSWLNTDSVHVCEVAVLGRGNYLPWRAAKACFQHQRDFNYIESRDLFDRATIDADGIHIAGLTYSVLIVEEALDAETQSVLAPLRHCGRIIHYTEDMHDTDLVRRIAAIVPADISCKPATAALRVRHVMKEGLHWYMLFNESRAPIEVEIDFSAKGDRLRYDASTGLTSECSEGQPIQLAGHEMTVFAVTEDGPTMASSRGPEGRG